MVTLINWCLGGALEKLRRVVIFYNFEEGDGLKTITCFVNKVGPIERGFIIKKLYKWNAQADYQGHQEVIF